METATNKVTWSLTIPDFRLASSSCMPVEDDGELRRILGYDRVAVIRCIDIVEIFQPSEEVPEIVEQALDRDDVKAIWMQTGIRNNGAVRTAEAAGLDVIQDHRMKVEHGRLIHHPMD